MVIGLSTCGKTSNEELFSAYATAGIEVMEISPRTEEYAGLDYGEIRALADKYGITLGSFHLPFMPFDALDISAPALAEATVRYLTELMDRASAIGIRTFVIHPSGEPIEECDRPARMACAKESLFRLAEEASKRGAVLAVENLPRTCLGRSAEDMEALIAAHPALRVCFDTNHLLGGDPVDLIRRLGERIVTLHVSDYDFVNERHWLPGEGKVDWQAVLAALREVGYQGPWLYEVPFACPNTILRDRPLTCLDVAENAAALFAGKEPPCLSRPKPNLGFWE